VVERSDLSVQDIATRFGCLVADLVATLTDDPGTEGFVESKEAQRQEVAEAGELGQAIFAADRASNARELTRLISTRGIEGAKRDKTGPGTRLRLWQRDLEMLEAHAPKLSRLPEMRAAIRDFAAVVVGLRAREHPRSARRVDRLGCRRGRCLLWPWSSSASRWRVVTAQSWTTATGSRLSKPLDCANSAPDDERHFRFAVMLRA
jgi:hypothetical protein